MNLIDEAESMILHQFAHSPKLIGLVRSLAEPFQEVLENIEGLYNGEYVNKAWGARLDVLGKIIGQPRRDMDDDTYRAWKDVGIRLNIGSGTPEDVLGILKILYGKIPEVLLHERQPNHLVFVFLTLPKVPMTALFAIMKSACPVTSQCIFVQGHGSKTALFDCSSFSQTHFCQLISENI